MMPINIMFVGAGRRTSMAEAFLFKQNCKLFSYESTQYVPISKYAQIIVGPKFINAKSHIEHVIDKYNISVCVPFYDSAIMLLSELALDYRNKCVCPDRTIAEICFNKKKFEHFILNSELAQYYPAASHNDYPKISKPINGCGSRDIAIIRCRHDDCGCLYGSSRIVQKYIENAEEFTVDFYVSKNGNYKGCCIRKRLRVAAGEVQDAITIHDSAIESLTEKIVEVFGGFRGPNCIQYLRGADGNLYIVEINTRFGGGAPLSLAVGFDMVEMLYDEYVFNREPKYMNYKADILMKRSYREEFFDVQSSSA